MERAHKSQAEAVFYGACPTLSASFVFFLFIPFNTFPSHLQLMHLTVPNQPCPACPAPVLLLAWCCPAAAQLLLCVCALGRVVVRLCHGLSGSNLRLFLWSGVGCHPIETAKEKSTTLLGPAPWD